MGAANPLGAMEETVRVARRLGVAGLKVAAVTGDDVLEHIDGSASSFLNGQGKLLPSLANA